MEKPTLLLHSCCAPCSSSVLERLTPDYSVTVFYYNPNIYPAEEYLRRKQEQLDFIARAYNGALPVIDCDYETAAYYAAVSGYESCAEGGERCALCFGLRLLKTAQAAKAGGFGLFCTTLTVSPHKNAAMVNAAGHAAAVEAGIPYLESDFKKKDGYLRSLRLSSEYGLYRQDYCGCRFSYDARKAQQ